MASVGYKKLGSTRCMVCMSWYHKGIVHEMGLRLMAYEKIWWMLVVVKIDGCGVFDILKVK